jgi:hypothetical protein
VTVAPPGAMCGDHPEQPAAEICSRCGKFVCANCLRIKPRGVFCGPCGARLLSNIDASWVAIAAAMCSFVGLGCGPLGAVAIVLAIGDLVAIGTGRSPAGGRKLDLIAIGLGLLGLLIGLAIVRNILGGGVNLDEGF